MNRNYLVVLAIHTALQLGYSADAQAQTPRSVADGRFAVEATARFQVVYSGVSRATYRICNLGPAVVEVLESGAQVPVGSCTDAEARSKGAVYELNVMYINGPGAKGTYSRL